MKKIESDVPQKVDASKQFCPNAECKSRGLIGQGNIVSHGSKRPRCKCKTCGKTFSVNAGTVLEGLRKPTELIVLVITLLTYGCPIQAIVHAFGLDERTVASWQQRAGKHCEAIHQEKIERGFLDLMHVQADEIRIKLRGAVVWVALAIMVSTRLWIAGQVSQTRDRDLIDRLLQQVRRCCKEMVALLICTDGLPAYPGSILRAFRNKVKNPYGIGAPRKEVWPRLYIGTVITYSVKRRVTEVIRWMTHGQWRKAKKLLKLSKGGKKLNTSFIERLNGTFRERLASFTRKCRHAASKIETVHTGMYLIGCTYNFCFAHHELSKSKAKGGYGFPCTPALASGITDHIWSVKELLT